MKVNGQAVRDGRKAKGLSREQLAVAVDVSTETIGRVERGNQGDVGASTLALIALEIDVDVNTLFDPPIPAQNGEAA